MCVRCLFKILQYYTYTVGSLGEYEVVPVELLFIVSTGVSSIRYSRTDTYGERRLGCFTVACRKMCIVSTLGGCDVLHLLSISPDNYRIVL